jgi:hypothetical protein
METARTVRHGISTSSCIRVTTMIVDAGTKECETM